MGECQVCCEPFTDFKRRQVTCAYCQYGACSSCYRQYILSSMQDAHCMNCRRAWSREMLGANFPSTWLLGRYKQHREAILVEREKQLLPQSQALVRNYRAALGLRSGIAEKTARLDRLKRDARVLAHEIHTDRYRAEALEARGYRDAQGAHDEQRTKRSRTEFSMPCPVEECRGYMGSEMTCGVCQSKGCHRCGVLLAENEDAHECSADDVASFKAIKSTTKPCPTCHVPTFKVSGCNQMWCTGCHATWDWNTGDPVEGVIHNPHYFQYLRERSANGEIPRQPGDVAGGGGGGCRRRIPTGWDVSTTLRARLTTMFFADLPRDPEDRKLEKQRITMTEEYRAAEDMGESLMTLQRKIIHVNEIDIPSLRRRFQDTDNADLRLKYLIHSISDDEFRGMLQRREKRREKDIVCRDIYQMVVDTAGDALWMFVDGGRSLEETLKELEAIRTYANAHLIKVQEQFKMVARKI